MSEGLPSYATRELHESEKLISYIPAPDLTARRRIIVAIFPLFVVMIFALMWLFSDRNSPVAGAAALYFFVALVVFALRLCQTSFIISASRVIRFVGGKKIEDVLLAEGAKPVLLNFAASDFFIWRWMARFFSLGPVVEVRRLKPEPWTVKAFFINRDLSRMRIGYPGHSLPTAKIFDDVTVAWEATQDAQEAT